MQADFLDAHERHWGDAETLFRTSRWANADHLYGIAAECGLKRLMVVFGMPSDSSTGRPAHASDRKHVNDIWQRFESYRSGKVEGVGYALSVSNPFGDWDVSDRYAHRSNFDTERVERHRNGALIVRELVANARREGLA